MLWFIFGPANLRVWRRTGPQELEQVAVRLGISDGIYSQLMPAQGTQLKDGEPLAVGLANPDAGGPRLKLGDKK